MTLPELLNRFAFVWVWVQQDRYPRPSGARAYAIDKDRVIVRPNAGSHRQVERVPMRKVTVNKSRMVQEPPPIKTRDGGA